MAYILVDTFKNHAEHEKFVEMYNEINDLSSKTQEQIDWLALREDDLTPLWVNAEGVPTNTKVLRDAILTS